MDCGHFISVWNWRYSSVGGRCFQRLTGCDDFRFICFQAQDLEIIKEKVKIQTKKTSSNALYYEFQFPIPDGRHYLVHTFLEP